MALLLLVGLAMMVEATLHLLVDCRPNLLGGGAMERVVEVERVAEAWTETGPVAGALGLVTPIRVGGRNESLHLTDPLLEAHTVGERSEFIEARCDDAEHPGRGQSDEYGCMVGGDTPIAHGEIADRRTDGSRSAGSVARLGRTG